MPSSDIIETGRGIAATAKVFRDLQVLSHRVNEVFRLVDPVFHANLKELQRRICNAYPLMSCFNAIDPLLMEGREFLFNRISGLHRDSQDPKGAYAGLMALGSFTSGGDVHIPELNLRVRLLPGDFVAIRGRILTHGIEPWFGGQRISIPHFTHTSLWRHAKMADRVSGIYPQAM